MDSSESVGGASTAAKTFQAKFTPKDTENYNTVENIELEVTVNKADGGNLKTVELEQKYTDAPPRITPTRRTGPDCRRAGLDVQQRGEHRPVQAKTSQRTAAC